VGGSPGASGTPELRGCAHLSHCDSEQQGFSRAPRAERPLSGPE
jgi:hypothetical protein